MRILIAGQKQFGAETYRLCLRLGIQVAAVCAPPWREGSDTVRDRLRTLAEDDGVKWIPAGKLSADTCPPDLDLIVAAHSHDFIGRKTLAATGLGGIGYHPSLLPLHRGRDAIRWAIHMREQVTGGTIYWLGGRIDGGPIAAQSHVFIRPKDTAETLWRRELFPLGIALFRRVLTDLQHRRIVRIPQPTEIGTFEPSWERERVWRPDLDPLPMIAGSGLDGYVVHAGSVAGAMSAAYIEAFEEAGEL